MTAALTVRFSGSDAMFERHRAVLASLPDHFRIAGDDQTPSDVVVIAGLELPSRPCRAVLLAQLVAANPTEAGTFAVAAGAIGVEVGVAYGHAADPTWTSVADRIAGDASGAVVIDSVVTAPDSETLMAGLLEQLATMRTLLQSLDGLVQRHRAPQQYLLGGLVDGVPVTLSGIVSLAGDSSMVLDVVGVERRWRVTWFADPLARPTVVTRLDAGGTHVEPLRFESGYRESWLAVHDRLSGVTGGPRTFERMTSDLTVLERCGMLPPVRVVRRSR